MAKDSPLRAGFSVGVLYDSGRVSSIVLTIVDERTGVTAQAPLTATEAYSIAASLQRAAEDCGSGR